MRCLPSLSQYLMAPTAPFFLLTFTGIFRQCEAKKHIHFGAHYYSLSLLLKGVQLILVSIVFIPPSERRVAVAIIAVTFNQREKYFTPKWYLKHWITHSQHSIQFLIGVDSFFTKQREKIISMRAKSIINWKHSTAHSTISSIPIRVYIRVFCVCVSITVLMCFWLFCEWVCVRVLLPFFRADDWLHKVLVQHT